MSVTGEVTTLKDISARFGSDNVIWSQTFNSFDRIFDKIYNTPSTRTYYDNYADRILTAFETFQQSVLNGKPDYSSLMNGYGLTMLLIADVTEESKTSLILADVFDKVYRETKEFLLPMVPYGTFLAIVLYFVAGSFRIVANDADWALEYRTGYANVLREMGNILEEGEINLGDIAAVQKSMFVFLVDISKSAKEPEYRNAVLSLSLDLKDEVGDIISLDFLLGRLKGLKDFSRGISTLKSLVS